MILENVSFPNSSTKENLVIPLDSEGNMLINWIKKDFNNSFNNESVLFLHELDNFEKEIIKTFAEKIKKAGFRVNAEKLIANYLIFHLNQYRY